MVTALNHGINNFSFLAVFVFILDLLMIFVVLFEWDSDGHSSK